MHKDKPEGQFLNWNVFYQVECFPLGFYQFECFLSTAMTTVMMLHFIVAKSLTTCSNRAQDGGQFFGTFR